MCIRNASEAEVTKLPAWGYYYKVLTHSSKSVVRYHKYRRGMNNIPECWQSNFGDNPGQIKAGGHFYRDRRDAQDAVEVEDERIVRFKILRRDISHVGKTWSNDKGVTVLARRAEMIGRVRP